MLLFGLTGGIGAGKSSVSKLLRARGAVVLDADEIVHSLQQPGQPVLAAMVAEFGEEILHGDGTLNRPAVAAQVFRDDAKLAKLGAIVHPKVTETLISEVQRLSETDHVVVLDIPLLVESGWPDLKGVIVVDVDPEIALHRILSDRDITESDARARMDKQVSRSERLARASFVVDNSGDRAHLTHEVDRLWAWIQGHSHG